MAKRSAPFPVNTFGGSPDAGVLIERISFQDLPGSADLTQPERHDRHSFFLLESGEVILDIDFKRYRVTAPSVIYMHPDQVHRILSFDNVTVSSWAINNESLRPDCLEWLAAIAPATPLPLDEETFSLLRDMVSIGLRLSQRAGEKLYHPLLKDSCSALVTFVASRYLEEDQSAEGGARFETVTKAFRALLEENYAAVKSPAAYARTLNLSAAYLNECVRSVTGHPVSHHIRQRVVLEAKRLLFHSDKSVKEIAAALGYEDSAYFSRMFAKTTGVSATLFKSKNHE